MAERVNKLARSLKELHLAATAEEAYTRAEEILLGNNKPQQDEKKDDKTLNELMNEGKRQQESLPEKNAPVEEIIIENNTSQNTTQT